MKHTLRTIADIMAVVNDGNIDNFIKDFDVWLRISVSAKEAGKAIAAFAEVSQAPEMLWIDDGKNEKNIIIEFASPPTDKDVIPKPKETDEQVTPPPPKSEGWERIRGNSELVEIMERYAEGVTLHDKPTSQQAADDLATFISRLIAHAEERGYEKGRQLETMPTAWCKVAIEQAKAELMAELREKVERIKRKVQEIYGTFKYDGCYDDVLALLQPPTDKEKEG